MEVVVEEVEEVMVEVVEEVMVEVVVVIVARRIVTAKVETASSHQPAAHRGETWTSAHARLCAASTRPK
jgi:hypothetical protein